MYTYQVELDMVLGENETRNKMGRLCVQGEVRDQITQYGLKSKIVNECGPGGGWPIVRLRGSRRAIMKYLREVYYEYVNSHHEDPKWTEEILACHPPKRVWVGKSPTAAAC